MNIKELLEIPNILYAISVADGLYKEKFAPAKTVQQVDSVRNELDRNYNSPSGKKILNAFRLRRIKELDPAEFTKRMGELTLHESIKKNTFSDLLDFYVDQIPGGKGDSKNPMSFDRRELIIGFFVEREHSNDPLKRIEIACDHLAENDKYYSDLVKSGVVDEPKAIEMYKKLYKVDTLNENVSEEDMLDIKSITAEKALENKSLGKLIGYNESFIISDDAKAASKTYFPVYLDVKKNGKGKVTVYAFNHYKSDVADKLNELGKIELDANALNIANLETFVRKHNNGKSLNKLWSTASGKQLEFPILVKAYMNIYLKILNQK